MPSSLTIGQLTAVPAADLVLTAEGSITWETLPDATELVLQAASVTLTATTLPTLVVDTTLIRATVLEAGNLIINRTGTGDLTVHASVRNGSMSVTNPGGAIELADVQLHTNADTSDLVVTAAGDITIGRISTGQFYASDADIPAGDADAAAGIHSLGDITLTSSGRISQNMADTAIDIIADRLTLEATLGIASLEIAVAELHAESTSGSISLTDLDSAGETVPGISSAILLAPAGSVTLHATGSIVIDQLTAGGNNGTAEVVSSGGDLRVLPGAASAPVTVQNKIDFRAAGTLRLPAFFTAPGTISYRAEQLIFNDATGSDGAGDGGGIPSVLQADTIVLEQRGGLTLKGISSITANRLELLTDANLFATDIGSVNVTELVMLARGLKTVTAEIYDGETGGTKQVQQPTGRINFQAVSVAAGIWDVRTSQEQFIELSQTGSTLLTVRGTLSGLVDSPRPQQLTFRASQPLRLQDAILAADTVTLSGTTISANAQTEIQATRISAEAAGSIRLYTASDVVSAVATGPGDVQITNTGTLTAELVSALNGTVALFATGNLTAVRVIQQTDGSGKDIQLTSDASIYVDYIDAGQAAGVNRAASKAILRAKGTIQEAPGRLDNAAPTDLSQQSAFNIVDVVAWKTIFYHDQSMAEPKLIQSASDVGQGTELEIVYTAFSGLVSGAPPAVEMPRQVFGDYTLNITGYLDDIDLTVTGILTINQVTSNPGQLIRFSAGEGLVLNTPVDVGTGTVTLETDGDLILNAVITAAELVINASTVSQPLTLDVERLSFDLPAGGNLQVNNSGSLTLGSANAGGGSVNITAASSLQIDGTITQVQSLNLSAGTSISTSAGSSLTVTGNARFSGPSINLGSAQGDSLHLGSLTVVTSGTATVVEDGDMVLSGTSSAAGLNLTATGLISEANASIAVTGGASLTASQITIGEDPTASWNVAGQLALNATGGGTIRVRGGAAAQFGSFALNTTGSADVFQQLSLQLSGSSAVGNLILNSGTNIVDNGSSVVVTGNAQFTAPVLSLLNDGDETLTIAGNALFESVSGGAITIAAGGTANFGSLTFRTTGTASISEDSDTTLTGSSTAGSLTLNSQQALTDNGASITVSGNASLTGGSIALTSAAGETLSIAGNASFASRTGSIIIAAAGQANFGSLTFDTTGTVQIHEDSSTSLAGTSNSQSLQIVSAGIVTDTDASGGSAMVSVSTDASITGTSIQLGNSAADRLDVTGNLNLTATTGNIDLQTDGVMQMGTLTFNSPGTVSIFEEDSTEIVGANTAQTLNITSAGALIDPAQIIVQDTAVFSGTSVYLAGDPADVLNIGGNVLLIATSGGSITVAAAGTVTMGSVTFQTTGTVLIAEDDGMLVTGANTAGTLTLLSAATLTNSSASNLAVTGLASLTAPTIQLGLASGDTVNFGSLQLQSTGSVTIVEDSSMNLVNTSTIGTLAHLMATGTDPDLTLTGTLQTTTGSILLQAHRDVIFAATGQLTSVSGNVAVTADAAGAGLFTSGAITMLDGAVLNAGSGITDLTAPGHIAVSSIASTSEVRITSTQGGIQDNGDTDLDLIGGSFALRTLLGIGSSNPLETDIVTLAVLQSGSAAVRIEENNDLTIGPVNGLGSFFSGGAVTISTGSLLTWAMNAVQPVLDATVRGSAASGEDIRVNSGITVRTTTGNLVLQAADSINVLPNALIQASTTEIILRSGLGDSDSLGGMTLDGTLHTATPGQSVTLDLNAQQAATQNPASGAILATGLRLLSTTASTATFTLTAGTRNDVDVLAALTSGAIQYSDLDDLTIGSIAASSSIPALNGISTVNDSSEGAAVAITAHTTLSVNQPVRTSPTGTPGSLNLGTVTLQSTTAAVSLSDSGDIFADGAVGLTAAGGIQTAGEITTSADNITYNSAVTLTDTVALTTGSGAGNIRFVSTVNGGADLTLTAGTGNITFQQAAGQSSRLRQVQIVSAADTTFSAAVFAENLLQNAGSGTTTFAGLLNTSDPAGVNLTDTNLHVVTGITTSGSGTVTVALTGTGLDGTAVFDNNAHINADGAVTLTASTRVSTGGNITTTNDNINITATVTLTQSIIVDSGPGIGNIAFNGTIDGTTVNTQSLTLDAGSGGTIAVTGAIGKSVSLQTLTIVDSNGAELGTADADYIVADTLVHIQSSQPAVIVRFNGGLKTPRIDADAAPYHLHFAGSG
ncbi:MAG: beta strand repeat-containing protein, partial [Planctomyces sp.]